jgi:flagellar hook-length control protein FliK
MNSVQMMTGTTAGEEASQSGWRGKNLKTDIVSQTAGGFKNLLQKARSSAKGEAGHRKEAASQEQVQDKSINQQAPVEPTISENQTASGQQQAQVTDVSDQENSAAVAQDSDSAQKQDDSVLALAGQDLASMVLMRTESLVSPENVQNSSPGSASDISKTELIPLTDTKEPAALTADVAAVPDKAAKPDIQASPELSTEPGLSFKADQSSPQVIDEKSARTANSKDQSSKDAELPIWELTAQTNLTTGKEQAAQDKGGDVKKVMNMESQRLSLNPLNTKQQEKTGDSETSSSSDDKDGLIAYTHQTEVEAPKTTFKETLTGESSFKQAVLDPKELISQVVNKAQLLLKQNSSEMNIQLKPDFLGKMTIKVTLADGVVTARFLTENQQVKNVLEQNIQSLRQSLEAQGIKVDKTEVNVQLDSGGMFGGFGDRQQELWQQQQGNSFSGMGKAQASEAGSSSLVSDLPVYSTVENLYGEGSDSIDYRI